MIERLALQAGGVAVFDPRLWFGAMSVSAALRWTRFYRIEPWGNKEAGLRTGLLALVTSDGTREIAVEDFVIAAPTSREAAEMEKWRQEAAEFDRWKRSGERHGGTR